MLRSLDDERDIRLCNEYSKFANIQATSYKLQTAAYAFKRNPIVILKK